jgi:xanthosine utilization system XapX-like protein
MLMRIRQKAGSILTLVGCTILTVMVGYQILSALRDIADPLIMKPPYGVYAIAVVLTLLADAGAVQLYRMASLAFAK